MPAPEIAQRIYERMSKMESLQEISFEIPYPLYVGDQITKALDALIAQLESTLESDLDLDQFNFDWNLHEYLLGTKETVDLMIIKKPVPTPEIT